MYMDLKKYIQRLLNFMEFPIKYYDYLKLEEKEEDIILNIAKLIDGSFEIYLKNCKDPMKNQIHSNIYRCIYIDKDYNKYIDFIIKRSCKPVLNKISDFNI